MDTCHLAPIHSFFLIFVTYYHRNNSSAVNSPRREAEAVKLTLDHLGERFGRLATETAPHFREAILLFYTATLY